MTYTRTGLVNIALMWLGKELLNDLDTDTSPLARKIRPFFGHVFRRCLRVSAWPFALRRQALAQEATAPENEFSYRFAIPSDSCKLVRMYPNNVPYRQEGESILTDAPSLTLQYVSTDSVDNPSNVSCDFADFFGLTLAAQLAPTTLDDTDRIILLENKADKAMKLAAAQYSQEDTEYQIDDSVWVTDRAYYNAEHDSIRIEGLE